MFYKLTKLAGFRGTALRSLYFQGHKEYFCSQGCRADNEAPPLCIHMQAIVILLSHLNL